VPKPSGASHPVPWPNTTSACTASCCMAETARRPIWQALERLEAWLIMLQHV